MFTHRTAGENQKHVPSPLEVACELLYWDEGFASNFWLSGPYLPRPLSELSVSVVASRLYAVGGVSTTNDTKNEARARRRDRRRRATARHDRRPTTDDRRPTNDERFDLSCACSPNDDAAAPRRAAVVVFGSVNV